MQYDWPGNIRELENMIKRIVILQDEQLVVREIERNIQRVVAVPAPAAAVYAVAGVGAPVPPRPDAAPQPAAARAAEAARGSRGQAMDAAAAAGAGLARDVAKAAAMKAERAAIEDTLRQVHWNRRKAAQILGVSYKTLLNKIKECGISRA